VHAGQFTVLFDFVGCVIIIIVIIIITTIIKTSTSRPRSRPRLYFLSYRRPETMTLVSRTTSPVPARAMDLVAHSSGRATQRPVIDGVLFSARPTKPQQPS